MTTVLRWRLSVAPAEGSGMPRTSQPGRSVSSRVLEVLFAFRPGRSRLTLAELTRSTGLPYATVRRLVNELVAGGVLEREPDGYVIGVRLWQLGTLAPRTVPLRTAALPFMEDLRTAVREHVQLAVLEGREAVVVERLSSPQAIKVISHVGGRLPLHSSGVGKVLLAHTEPEVVDRYIAGGLDRRTAHTITDPDRLRQVLAECRESGVATVHEETSPGADSVATRIMDAEGRVIAALSVVVRTGTANPRSIKATVLTSGLGISRRLGWTPSVGVHNSQVSADTVDCG
jgi:DNA-binding IclR family transcriptional regulator